MARADVSAFHRSRYVPGRVTIIAAGDGSHDELAGLVAGAFESWSVPEDARAGARRRLGAAARARRTAGDRAPTRCRAVGASHRDAAVPRSTPDYHALVVMNMVLGGQFVSRINMNLRESKGYTYGARTAFEFRRGPGPFVLQASVQSDRTVDAIAEVFDEIAAIRGARPVTALELETGRAGLTRGYPRSFETADQMARAAAQLTLHDLPDDYFTTFVPKVLAIDEAEATRVAVRHLDPSRLFTVAVGDRERIGSGSPASASANRLRVSAPTSPASILPTPHSQLRSPTPNSRTMRVSWSRVGRWLVGVQPGTYRGSSVERQCCGQAELTVDAIMSFARISLSLAGIVGALTVAFTGALIAARGPTRQHHGDGRQGEISPLMRSVAGALYQALQGLLKYLSTPKRPTPNARRTELLTRVWKLGVGLLGAQRFPRTAERQPVHPLERTLAGAVVPARQHHQLVRHAAVVERAHEGPGEIDREREVVARVHEQHTLALHPLEKRERRDGHPDPPQILEGDVALEPAAHVLGGEPAPHDVREVGRDVIEGGRAHSGSCAAVSSDRHEPRLVPRMPIDS